MLKILSAALLALIGFTGCKQSVRTESQTAYAVGSWWAQSNSNLLLAVSRNQPLSLCLDSEGSVDASKFSRDTDHFRTVVRLALIEWMRAIRSQVQIKDETGPCKGDVAAGKLKVVLHYNESTFQREISQTSSPTLGVYLIGSGSLYLNVAGVTNPRRDSTGGYKTALHELGHAFGLHHSNVAGAVMLPNLSTASAHLTADDVRGIEAVWQQIQKSNNQANGAQPVAAETSVAARSDNPSKPRESVSALGLRHETWFKSTTQQSTELTEQQKCPLKQGQVLRVKVLDEGQTTSSHLRVQLEEELSGCGFGSRGQIGFLYQPHVD